ncbi:hypothetical protein CI109_101157 [Kwoniella shandongensis]|uniref:Uncharacterized protein n=1 Tax=Kwoniella shandongensis TaxID=1734106 RepID=A0A5M6CAV4_9TREE|nr:uncharacterized protein CI109_001626 [Kwoniella shandongensis]KAA5530219.1 hypothetical protein CI109_001626 [Kwoniella shandongensis]
MLGGFAARRALRTRATTVQRCASSLARAQRIWGNRLVVSEEVTHALETSSPVIALESAIITHGMPNPTNLTTAQSLERIIRSKSVVPATIALIKGRIHVGLSDSQLTELSDPQSEIARGGVKVSRRDLGPAIALGKTGGTTVAGTMYVGSSLGIKVFVTGGIGGVHRGAESSMDISADLIELGRTPMAVICAGAKSILDIPRTLEVLETQGVCVATYGGKQDFPAFYHPSSGCQSPWRVPDASSAASLIHTSLTLPTPLSTLLAVPIPSEHTEAGAAVQSSVEQAVRESIEQGVDKRGKEVTPWLLKRVGELTKGKALELNVKLIENNARVGAEVAIKVAELFQTQHASSSIYYSPAAPSSSSSPTSTVSSTVYPSSSPSPSKPLPPPSVLVFGSAAIDLTSTSPQTLVPGTTTPGTVFLSPGGVGRNIAEATQNLLSAGSVQLISAYGLASDRIPTSSDVDRTTIEQHRGEGEPDAFGKLLKIELGSAGLRTDGLIGRQGGNTSVCSLTLEKDGDLVAGVADMGIVETLTADVIEQAIREKRPKMVVFDCNLLEGVIMTLLETCQSLNIPTFCDPTSTPKLPRLLPSLISLLPTSPTSPRPLSHLSPNVLELDLLHNLLTSTVEDNDSSSHSKLVWEYINSLNLDSDWRNSIERFTSSKEREWIRKEGVVQKMVTLLPFIGEFWVKASNRGLLHLRLTSSPPPPSGSPISIVQKLGGVHQGKYLALTHYSAPKIDMADIVSTTGAGDTLVGGLVAGLVDSKSSQEEVWVDRALQRVVKSLKSRRAVG